MYIEMYFSNSVTIIVCVYHIVFTVIICVTAGESHQDTGRHI